MSEITKEALLETLPTALKNDTKLNALATAIADVLEDRVTEIGTLAFYKQIDSMPEALLDILAYDFKVDWWSQKYTVAEKRNILKSNWHMHKKLGVKDTVVTGLSDIYESSTIEEWYEYGGMPYHFKVVIDQAYQQGDQEKRAEVLRRVALYKNLRSYLDAVEFVEIGYDIVSYSYTEQTGMAIAESATTQIY